jgi:hypothetical protein
VPDVKAANVLAICCKVKSGNNMKFAAGAIVFKRISSCIFSKIKQLASLHGACNYSAGIDGTNNSNSSVIFKVNDPHVIVTRSACTCRTAGASGACSPNGPRRANGADSTLGAYGNCGDNTGYRNRDNGYGAITLSDRNRIRYGTDVDGCHAV